MSAPDPSIEVKPISVDSLDIPPVTANKTPSKSLTRRAFATGAAAAIGSLFLEPVLGKENTYWLPGCVSNSSSAYAIETSTISVTPGTIAVACFDDKYQIIKAKVKVKSLYNGKEFEAETTSTGIARFSTQQFNELAEYKYSEAIGGWREFDACITIDCTEAVSRRDLSTYEALRDKYRDVVIPRIHISDEGWAINGPMKVIESARGKGSDRSWHTKPYFKFISFDDWDIQYSTQEFALSEFNDVSHSLKASLWFGESAKYSVQPIISKSDTPSREGQAIADPQIIEGSAGETKEIDFASRQYLLTTSSDVILPGDVIDIVISDPSKSGNEAKLYSITTGLSVSQSQSNSAESVEGSTDLTVSNNAFEDDDSTAAVNLAGINAGSQIGEITGSAVLLGDEGISLLSDNYVPLPKRASNVTCSLPNSLPEPLNGLSASSWTPILPLKFNFDPGAGTFLMGIDLDVLNFTNKKDEYTGDTSWRCVPAGEAKDQWDRRLTLAKLKFREAMENDWTGKKSLKFTGYWSFDISFQALWQATYSAAKKMWQGDVGVGMTFGVSGVCTSPVGIFALYLDLGLYIKLALRYTWLTEAPDETCSLITMWRNTYFNNEENMSANFNVRLTAALMFGFKGFAAIGVRATGGFSALMQYRTKSEKFANKPNPRWVIGLSGEVALAIETFLFSNSWAFLKGSWPTLADTDDDDASVASLNESSNSTIDAEYSDLQAGGAYHIPGNDPYPSDPQNNIDLSRLSIVTESKLANMAELNVITNSASQDGEPELASTTSSTSMATSENALPKTEVELLTAAEFSSDTVSCTGSNIKSATMPAPENLTTNANDDGDISLFSVSSSNGYEYSWNNGHEAQYTDRGAGNDTIYCLGTEGGVRPRHMNLLAKDVCSQSRSRLIEIDGNRYLFRIAPVNYDGKPLSRVVYQQITDSGVSKPFPIEFETATAGKLRTELYDYDFDISIVNKNGTNQGIMLMVISGERPDADDTSIFQAAEATIASVVNLDMRDEESAATAGAFYTSKNISWDSPQNKESGKYYSFRLPYMLDRTVLSEDAYNNVVETDGYEHGFGFFLLDSADTKEELLSINRDGSSLTTSINIVHVLFAVESIVQWPSVSLPAGAMNIVPCSAQIVPNEDNSIIATFGFTVDKGSGVQALKLTFDKDDSGYNKLASVKSSPVMNVDPRVKTLHPWGEANALLATLSTEEDVTSNDNINYLAQTQLPEVSEINQHIDDGIGFATFDATCVSPKNIPIGYLHLRSDSKYCYYATNHSGYEGYTYDEDGNPTPKVGDPQYNIMAIAQVEGIFTEPFIFAECDTPIDSFYVTEETLNPRPCYSSFVTRNITKLSDSIADLYTFDVPFLRSISTVEIGPTTSKESPARDAIPGETKEFTISLKNTGNTVLTQVTVRFTDTDSGELLCDKVLNFKEATNGSNSGLIDDSYLTDLMSEAGEASILVADSGNAALIPGQIRSFKVNIDIPEDWTGTKSITATALSESLHFADPVSGEIVNSSTSTAEYETAESNSAAVEITIPADVDTEPNTGNLDGKVIAAGEDDANGNGSDGKNETDGSSSASNGKTAPSTGDSSIGGLAALALGAAGAGFAAYSARRAKLENGELDDEEEQ